MYEDLRELLKKNLDKFKLPIITKVVDDTIVAWEKNRYRVFNDEELHE